MKVVFLQMSVHGGGICGMGACMAGGMCGEGHAWGACVVRECLWWGACVAGVCMPQMTPPQADTMAMAYSE